MYPLEYMSSVGRFVYSSAAGTGTTGGTGALDVVTGAGRTGAGGTGPRGASAGVPGIGGTRGADTGGTIVLVPGASWRDSLSPQHLREWAARWGSPGGGAGGTGSGGAVATGARGTGYGGVVTTGAGGSRGATTQAQQSALSHLLSFLPAVTEFPFAGTTPPLLFPPPYQSQPQLLSHSPLPAPAPYTAVTESLTESRESVSRPVTPVHTRAVRPRPPPVPCTHIMALRPSSVPQRAILPSPTASSLPHVPDPEVKRPPGSPPAFKARYVARGFSQLYGLHQAPREWHDTVRTTLAALGFAPSTTDPSLFLHTDTSLPPFYVLVYVNDLVFATADTEAQALVKAELQERHTCTDLGPSALRLRVLLATAHSSAYRPLALNSTFGRVHASWADDQTTHRSTQGYSFSLGTGSVSWRSTCSSSVLSSSCEAEIYAGAMAAQELRWLTYLLTDLGERPRSPPVLYVDKKAMIALCQDQRLEHRTKHIALRYFLTRELQ
ncbi:unnamed protein product [Closterium sp. NIES-53]